MPAPNIPCFVISLPTAKARRAMQRVQAERYGLTLHFIDAIDANSVWQTHRDSINHWHRPMALKESACCLSHIKAWQAVAKQNQKVLVMEDDSVLSDTIADALHDIDQRDDDWRTVYDIEWVPRKHQLARHKLWQGKHTKAHRLYLNRNGAGAYILGPKAAAKLLAQTPAITLVDAHMWHQRWMHMCQIEPALSIQLLYLDPDQTLEASQPYAPTVHDHTIQRRPIVWAWLHRILFEIQKGPRWFTTLLWGENRMIAVEKNHFHLPPTCGDDNATPQ